MENNKKSAGTIALVVLLLIVTIASLILATYAWAKYTTTESGNATANVAKWNVNFTENQSTFVGHYNHVVYDKVAPGTNGSFQVTVNPNNTETCFNYTITVDSVEFYKGTEATEANKLLDTQVLATIDGTEYTLSQFRSHIKVTGDSKDLLTDGNVLTGTYNLGDGNAHNSSTNAAMDPATKTISWAWDYQDANVENYDQVDTAAGQYAAANGLIFKINYTITATQVNPANANH